MTDAQTEARAIAQDIVDEFYPMDDVPAHMIADVASRIIATALEAQAAELATLREADGNFWEAIARAERAEAQLAEARKAHSTILAVLGNVEHRGGGPNAARMYADMLNDIREIARRALTGGNADD